VPPAKSSVVKPTTAAVVCTGCSQVVNGWVCKECDDGDRKENDRHIIQLSVPLAGFSLSDISRRLVQRSLRVAFMISFGLAEADVNMLTPASLPVKDPIVGKNALWTCGTCDCKMCSVYGMDADAALEFLQNTEFTELNHIARTYGGKELSSFEKALLLNIQDKDPTSVSEDQIRKIWNSGFNTFSHMSSDSSTLYCKTYNLDVSGEEGFVRVEKAKGTQGVWFYGVDLKKNKLQFDGFPPTAPPTQYPTAVPTAPTSSPTQFPTRFPTPKKADFPMSKDTSLHGRISRLEIEFYGSNTTGSLLGRLGALETVAVGSTQRGLLWSRVAALEGTFATRVSTVETSILGSAKMGPLLGRIGDLELLEFGEVEVGSMNARVMRLEDLTYTMDHTALPGRISMLEEEIYSEEKTGDLELRVWGLEQAMIGSSLKTTGGGGGNAVGDTCNFPFIWKNITYDSCTSTSHDRAWCYTVSGATAGSAWGECGPLYLRVAALEGTFSKRVWFLEKRLFGQEQVGGLEIRLWNLEIEIFGEKQSGALWGRMETLETDSATKTKVNAASPNKGPLDTGFMQALSERTAALEQRTYNLAKAGAIEGRLDALEISILGNVSTAGEIWQRLEKLESDIAGDLAPQRRMADAVPFRLVVTLGVSGLSALEEAEDKLNNVVVWQEFQTNLATELTKFGENELKVAVTNGAFVAGVFGTFKKAPSFGSGGGFDDDDDDGMLTTAAAPTAAKEVVKASDTSKYIIAIVCLVAVILLMMIPAAHKHCCQHKKPNKVLPKEGSINPTLVVVGPQPVHNPTAPAPKNEPSKPPAAQNMTYVSWLVVVVVITVLVIVFSAEI